MPHPDLEELAAALAGTDIAVSVSVDRLRRLAPYTVGFRCGDEAVDMLLSVKAVGIIERALTWTTNLVGESLE